MENWELQTFFLRSKIMTDRHSLSMMRSVLQKMHYDDLPVESRSARWLWLCPATKLLKTLNKESGEIETNQMATSCHLDVESTCDKKLTFLGHLGKMTLLTHVRLIFWFQLVCGGKMRIIYSPSGLPVRCILPKKPRHAGKCFDSSSRNNCNCWDSRDRHLP